MDKKTAKELRQDLLNFFDATKEAIIQFDERIHDLQQKYEDEKQAAKTSKRQEGYLVDYKTFSEVINALVVMINSGETVYQPIYEKLIKIGKEQHRNGDITSHNNTIAQTKHATNMQAKQAPATNLDGYFDNAFSSNQIQMNDFLNYLSMLSKYKNKN